MSRGGGEDDQQGLSMQSMMKEMTLLKDKFKSEDEEAAPSPYADLSKSTVLQESRIFHDSKQVKENPRNCCTIITKLLHIVSMGQSFNSVEVTDVFFGVTKLFQSSDPSLRRMVYLFIKEVAESCNPDDVIIVTSSLTKDMNSDIDMYRSNSIRVLARIVDSAMLGAIERYVKQAIVDKHPLVSSSALVSAAHLFAANGDNATTVRRWLNEVQTALSNSNEMVQYHALCLLYQIKAHDRLAVSKLVSQLSKTGALKSPLATVSLIRYTCKLIHDENSDERNPSGSDLSRAGYGFLEASLRHRNEMVVYEAAKGICSLPSLDASDLNPAVTVLQMFLNSSKPCVRYAAMKTLSNVAFTCPLAVGKCNEDMEVLIGDANRSIATLAITTLLKTGTEGAVERLMKQIASFMNDISDDHKVVVVTSIRELCLKYPAKHRVLIGFLSNFLREEGGFEFKKAIVDVILSLMEHIPETKEGGLLQLCEFIEDCEFTALSTNILHMIGTIGPSTTEPARYIRFIYNRVILENACVRAAAVTALARFGAKVPSLRESVVTLLKRSLLDEDDEVRDRTALAVEILNNAIKDFPYSPGSSSSSSPGGAEDNEAGEDKPSTNDSAAFLILEPLPMTFSQLERSVKVYASAPGALESSEPLTFTTLPIVEVVEDEQADKMDSSSSSTPRGANQSASSRDVKASKTASEASNTKDPAAVLYAIPSLASLGRVFRSATPVSLTESETEYVVKCTKHVFTGHVVLQFSVLNTIDDQRLSDVTVDIGEESSGPDAALSVTGFIPCPSIKYGETGDCFVVLTASLTTPFTPTSFTCDLKFTVTPTDPTTGADEGDEYTEEYPMEVLQINTADYMSKVSLGDFRRSWENMGNEGEVLEKFNLQFKRLSDAVVSVINFFGMTPNDGTETVKQANSTVGGKPHMLHLSGVFVGAMPVMVRAQMSMSDSGVLLKIAVRSEDGAISRRVADCIR